MECHYYIYTNWQLPVNTSGSVSSIHHIESTLHAMKLSTSKIWRNILQHLWHSDGVHKALYSSIHFFTSAPETKLVNIVSAWQYIFHNIFCISKLTSATYLHKSWGPPLLEAGVDRNTAYMTLVSKTYCWHHIKNLRIWTAVSIVVLMNTINKCYTPTLY